jgi:hypothetical protein
MIEKNVSNISGKHKITPDSAIMSPELLVFVLKSLFPSGDNLFETGDKLSLSGDRLCSPKLPESNSMYSWRRR